MARTQADYAGARGRIDFGAASRLSGRHVVQPKVDGAYVTLVLDGCGRIADVLSRRGKAISHRVHQLQGVRVGRPWSILTGELEAFTEPGRRAAQTNPDRLPSVHVFDAIQVGTERVVSRPYRERRDLIMSAWAELGTETPTTLDRALNHHDGQGRFCSVRRAGWQRVRPVPQFPVSRLESVWADVVERQGGEGLVVVNLDAPMGARSAKRKLKVADTIDATIVSVEQKAVIAHWLAADVAFSVGRNGKNTVLGSVWEVKHDGFYDDGLPKFPRLVRERVDLR